MRDEPIQGNQAKSQSYRLAHERTSAAIEAGFPLETVAIAESLLTDRLLSFAVFHRAPKINVERDTLGKAAREVIAICQRLEDAQGEALAEVAKEWANERNAVLHAIAKSAPGSGPEISAESFVAHAHKVAQRGVELVKGVQAWHQQRLRAAPPSA